MFLDYVTLAGLLAVLGMFVTLAYFCAGGGCSS